MFNSIRRERVVTSQHRFRDLPHGSGDGERKNRRKVVAVVEGIRPSRKCIFVFCVRVSRSHSKLSYFRAVMNTPFTTLRHVELGTIVQVAFFYISVHLCFISVSIYLSFCGVYLAVCVRDYGFKSDMQVSARNLTVKSTNV